MSNVPIADYALLSDCRSATLVNRAGSVDWLCFPRFDGPSVFARLLDEQAGHWSIYTVGATEVSRRYIEGTMALETTFRTPTGVAVLVDAMAIGRNERGHELGVDSPGIVLRTVSCQSGTVELELEYAPRFEYGLIYPLLRPIQGGIVARGGADVLVLSSPMVLSIEGSTARARFALQAGEQASFALQHTASWEKTPEVYTQEAIADYLHDTVVDGVPGRTCIRGMKDRGGTSFITVVVCCKLSCSAPREPSSLHLPPLCLNPSGESATGTTATPGFVTPP